MESSLMPYVKVQAIFRSKITTQEQNETTESDPEALGARAMASFGTSPGNASDPSPILRLDTGSNPVNVRR